MPEEIKLVKLQVEISNSVDSLMLLLVTVLLLITPLLVTLSQSLLMPQTGNSMVVVFSTIVLPD